MYAYKLFRVRKDGTLGSLFVGRQKVLPIGQWLEAETNLSHPGLAHRPGFHCCAQRLAPHIKLRLANGEVRWWYHVEIEDEAERHERPESQGGLWYVAKRMRIVKVFWWDE